MPLPSLTAAKRSSFLPLPDDPRAVLKADLRSLEYTCPHRLGGIHQPVEDLLALPGKVLLKGTKILSPFSDSEEVVVRVARDFVPAAAELGRRTLTPHEIRDWLKGS